MSPDPAHPESPRRVLLCPDSWGGFASAAEVTEGVATALADLGLELRCLPLGDGGEGTAAVLAAPELGRRVRVGTPRGPRVLRARHLADGRAFLESALALGDGRGLRPEGRDPRAASSHGLGAWLAAEARFHEGPLVLGLGGSATSDGGLGLALALGLSVRDAAGSPLPLRGDSLLRAAYLEGPRPSAAGRVSAWCDVRTPLAEAARVYGPQKGLGADEIPAWSAALSRWGELLARWRDDQDLPPLDPDLSGGGAAGGVGFALAALLDAPLEDGAAAVARALDLDGALAWAELVLTGEGRLDGSSLAGKVVGHVARRARALGRPCWAMVGRSDLDAGSAREAGLERVLSCPEEPDPAAAFEGGLDRLREALREALRTPCPSPGGAPGGRRSP